MPSYRYRALTERGDVVSGLIAAPTAAEVARRIDYLKLVPIGPIVEQGPVRAPRFDFSLGRRARAEDVTTFTLDLALLLKAGARLDDALELLASDADIGRLRPIVSAIRSSILSGENFANAVAQHSALFPPMYVALVRVGEASGTLVDILQMLARERSRAEALRRKITGALQYPAFVLFAAVGVLVFFLMYVLPQFSTVLRDSGAEIDPIASIFISLSDFLTTNADFVAAVAIIVMTGGLLAARKPKLRLAILSRLMHLPFVRTVTVFNRTVLFCRNLDILLAAAVPLTSALRILADMMSGMGDTTVWSRVVDRVRHGGKLSEALAETSALPAMAVRMLRLGEETGQLPILAGRVAEFYETKLQRSLERMVGLIGPLAIVTISIIVGGLIVSLMSSLLSVSELVG